MMDITLPPLGILLATIASAFMAGLARGFSGFGAAMIFIPLASATLGPRIASPVLLVVDYVTTFPMVPAAWRQAGRREVGVMAIGALVGGPMGAFLLAYADQTQLRWGVCVTALLMLAFLASGWRYRGVPSTPLSITVGGLSGLLSGAMQMGGPPIIAYWLGGSSIASRVRANIVLFFAATGTINAVVYIASRLLTVDILAIALIIAPAYAVGVWGGSRLFGRASETVFRRASYGLVCLAVLIGLPLWG